MLTTYIFPCKSKNKKILYFNLHVPEVMQKCELPGTIKKNTLLIIGHWLCLFANLYWIVGSPIFQSFK